VVLAQEKERIITIFITLPSTYRWLDESLLSDVYKVLHKIR
jgi:hypothetical protein